MPTGKEILAKLNQGKEILFTYRDAPQKKLLQGTPRQSKQIHKYRYCDICKMAAGLCCSVVHRYEDAILHLIRMHPIHIKYLFFPPAGRIDNAELRSPTLVDNLDTLKLQKLDSLVQHKNREAASKSNMDSCQSKSNNSENPTELEGPMGQEFNLQTEEPPLLPNGEVSRGVLHWRFKTGNTAQYVDATCTRLAKIPEAMKHFYETSILSNITKTRYSSEEWTKRQQGKVSFHRWFWAKSDKKTDEPAAGRSDGAPLLIEENARGLSAEQRIEIPPFEESGQAVAVGALSAESPLLLTAPDTQNGCTETSVNTEAATRSLEFIPGPLSLLFPPSLLDFSTDGSGPKTIAQSGSANGTSQKAELTTGKRKRNRNNEYKVAYSCTICDEFHDRTGLQEAEYHVIVKHRFYQFARELYNSALLKSQEKSGCPVRSVSTIAVSSIDTSTQTLVCSSSLIPFKAMEHMLQLENMLKTFLYIYCNHPQYKLGTFLYHGYFFTTVCSQDTSFSL